MLKTKLRRTVFIAIVLTIGLVLTGCYSDPILEQTTSTSPGSQTGDHSREDIELDGWGDCGLFESAKTLSTDTWQEASSDEAGISVRYPQSWQCEILPYIPATSSHEASLMWGLELFLEGSEPGHEFISVVKLQSKAIGWLSYPRYDVQINDLNRAQMAYQRFDGEYAIYIAFNDHIDHAVVIRITEDHFKQHQSDILGILSSISFE